MAKPGVVELIYVSTPDFSNLGYSTINIVEVNYASKSIINLSLPPKSLL